MKRHIIASNDSVLQILQHEPLFVPTGTFVIEYDGDEPDSRLTVINGEVKIKEVESVSTPIEISVQLYQTEQVNKIEDRIASIRSNYSSSKAGQLEVYWEKTQEAIDYVAAGCPDDLTGYPFISIEVAVTNNSGKQVARDILSKRKQWIDIASKTEKIRRLSRQQILICKSKKEVDSVVQQATKELSTIT